MDWRKLLKDKDAEGDQCYTAIMKWFEENPDRRVNENELTLMPFKRYKKSQRVWVPFATETIGRKARKLREFGILESGKDTSGHTWFSYPGGKPVQRFKWEVVIENGQRVAKRVPV